MGYRYRENDRYYGRGAPSRDEDDYYERRGPPPSFAGRDKRNDDRSELFGMKLQKLGF